MEAEVQQAQNTAMPSVATSLQQPDLHQGSNIQPQQLLLQPQADPSQQLQQPQQHQLPREQFYQQQQQHQLQPQQHQLPPEQFYQQQQQHQLQPDQPYSAPHAADVSAITMSVSLLINQTVFAGNLDCLSATPIHAHPRRYFAVLVAQNNSIAGLFLYDPIEDREGGISISLNQAVDALALDSSTDDFVSFEDTAFSVVSVNDAGESHRYQFVCENAAAAASWRHHLSPLLQQSVPAESGQIAPAVSNSNIQSPHPVPALSAKQSLLERLAQPDDSLTAITDKLSSLEVAYRFNVFCCSSPLFIFSAFLFCPRHTCNACYLYIHFPAQRPSNSK
jgi:hypothetical protein